MTDSASVNAAVCECEEAFGRLDVLVNNAGYGYLAAVEEGEDDAVRLFDANLHGIVTALKAALPGMRVRRSGRRRSSPPSTATRHHCGFSSAPTLSPVSGPA